MMQHTALRGGAPHRFIKQGWRSLLLVSAILICLIVADLSAQGQASTPQDRSTPLGIGMEGYDYPYQLRYFDLVIEGKQVRMAYGDIKPAANSNGQSVLLLHGRDFYGAYWDNTIRFLTKSGYRVIVPDQIGFGKSTKPNIHYSFQRLAYNTKLLLDELGIEYCAVIGHSMGGMLATRFALMYPSTTTRLILENPLGLEDYRTHVPYRTIEEWYQYVLSWTERSIRAVHESYFVNWNEKYSEYAYAQLRWSLSADYPRMAWVTALTFDMIYTQPVCHEFANLQVPTLVYCGAEDRTFLGRDFVPDSTAAKLGEIPRLAGRAVDSIPDGELRLLKGAGHIPHLEAPTQFHIELLTFLK